MVHIQSGLLVGISPPSKDLKMYKNFIKGTAWLFFKFTGGDIFLNDRVLLQARSQLQFFHFYRFRAHCAFFMIFATEAFFFHKPGIEQLGSSEKMNIVPVMQVT